MSFPKTSDAARDRMREAARKRSAALEPRNAEIRDEYDQMTKQGFSPGFVRRRLASGFNLSPERIVQILAEKPR